MNWKKLSLATVVGGISMWLLAGAWHTLIMARFYADAVEADHEGTGVILIAYFVLAALMAYLYPRLRNDGRPAVEGLKFGVIIGVLWVFPHALAMAGAHGESLTYVFQNTAWHLIEQGVGGVVISLVYRR